MLNDLNKYNTNYNSMFGSEDFNQFSGIGRESGIDSFGWNMPTYKLGLQGVMGLGSLWAAFKGLNQAKREFEFNKRITEKNLANNTKSYNTALEDRIKARQSASGNMTDSDVKRYMELNQLSN